jgi:hypothetical protein
MSPRNPRGWSYLAVSGALACFIGAGGTLRAQQPAPPSAREIVDRFVREAGGQPAFKAIKSIRARGTLSIAAQGLSGDVETILARPSKMITRVNVAGVGKLEEGFDGKIGWSIDPVNGPALVTGHALIERGDEAWFDASLHTPDFVKEMTVSGRETFDKRPAYRIKVKLSSGTEQEELYDVDTGFQLGLEATRDTPYGSAPTTTIYRDYQKFGSVKLPKTQVTKILGIEQVVTFTSYDFDVVPSSAFDLPAVIKALLK